MGLLRQVANKQKGRLSAAYHNVYLLFVRQSLCAFRFLRQPGRPRPPRPVAKRFSSVRPGWIFHAARHRGLAAPAVLVAVYPDLVRRCRKRRVAVRQVKAFQPRSHGSPHQFGLKLQRVGAVRNQPLTRQGSRRAGWIGEKTSI
jgi:hypothetical protein